MFFLIFDLLFQGEALDALTCSPLNGRACGLALLLIGSSAPCLVSTFALFSQIKGTSPCMKMPSNVVLTPMSPRLCLFQKLKVKPAPTSDFVAPPNDFISTVNASDWRAPDLESVERVADSLLGQQGVIPGTYVTEKLVTALTIWAGIVDGRVWPNPRIPSLPKPEWSVAYIVLLPKSLMVVFSDAGEMLGLVLLNRCDGVEAFDPRLADFPACRAVKLSNALGLPVTSWSSAPALYIVLPSDVMQERWLSNLTEAAVQCGHAMDRAFSKCPPPRWLEDLSPEAEGGESLEWFNLFLERYFADMFQSQTFYFRTMMTMSQKLLLVRKPAWIGSITLKELDIGSANVVIDFVSFHSSNHPKEMIGVVDFVYKGGMRISFGVILNIGKSVRVPVEVLIHFESLSGRMYMSAPATLHGKWSAYFMKMPSVNVNVKVTLGGIDKKVEVTSLNRVHAFVQKTFMRQVELALVFPSRLRFFLPVATRKSNLKTLRFNAELGGYQYVIPLDPSMLLDTFKSPLAQVDARKDTVETWEMHDSLRAKLRQFIARRLFGTCLNLGYLSLMSQLLSPGAHMTAGVPQIELVGETQIFDHFKRVYTAFEDFEVKVLGISFDETGDVICRWRLSGVQAHALWDVPASGKRVEMYALSLVMFEKDELRIARVRTMYKFPILTQTLKH